jgi:hypothetical protein
VLAVFVPATLSAQTGSIAGTTQDTTGAVLPGATVAVASSALRKGALGDS